MCISTRHAWTLLRSRESVTMDYLDLHTEVSGAYPATHGANRCRGQEGGCCPVDLGEHRGMEMKLLCRICVSIYSTPYNNTTLVLCCAATAVLCGVSGTQYWYLSSPVMNGKQAARRFHLVQDTAEEVCTALIAAYPN